MEILTEFVGEALFAAVACFLAGLVIAGAFWGWNRHPLATTIAGAAMALLLDYGAWSLRPAAQMARDRGQGLRIAGIAVAALSVTAVWLLYVVTYCTCA